MKQITLFLSAFMLFSSMLFASEGGKLTSNPSPIIPTASVTISYDGTGTNFANWTPKCFIHYWLVPKAGETFVGSYAPAWAPCNSEAEYTALDAKLKMTYDGIAGKYSIDIADVFLFANVLEADKSKVDKIGIIVRAQYSGASNQTIDFVLPIDASTPTSVVDHLNSDAFVSTQEGVISVNVQGVAKVEVYTLTGVLIASSSVEGQFSQVVQAGVYVVCINGKAQKVIVK